jgi:hypothetical protein
MNTVYSDINIKAEASLVMRTMTHNQQGRRARLETPNAAIKTVLVLVLEDAVFFTFATWDFSPSNKTAVQFKSDV